MSMMMVMTVMAVALHLQSMYWCAAVRVNHLLPRLQVRISRSGRLLVQHLDEILVKPVAQRIAVRCASHIPHIHFNAG